MDSPGPPPETSNFYCLPGRAGGTPGVLVGRNGSAEASWVKVGVTRVAVSLGLTGAVLPAGRSNRGRPRCRHCVHG
jgi:hypothetical protein